MMETPLGILNAVQIAGAHERLEGFVLGTNDLVKDIHGLHTPDRSPVLTALSISIMAARAHWFVCVDGGYNDIKDIDGLRAQAEHGRALGMDGITLIHPAQLEPANEVYAPSEADLTEAQAFVEAYAQAISEGKAVAVVNGRIVENLHVDNAKRILAQAKAIAEMEA
jgi:citrate lyase beta subunit